MLTAMDVYQLQPEIILLITASVVLLLDAFLKEAGQRLMYYFAEAGLLGAMVSLLLIFHGSTQVAFEGQVIQDQMAILLKMGICVVAFLVYAYAFHFNRAHQISAGSFWVLSLFAIIGALVLCSAQHLLLIYLGLELVTLPMLALIALPRDEIASEAAMKYFVLSALASGFLLYGISLWYGLTGTLYLQQLAQVLTVLPMNSGTLFSVVFLGIGVCFKLGVVPFHMWVPDAYQGAPLSVAGLLATVSKLAAFALLLRVFITALASLTLHWQIMLIAVAALSISLANMLAVVQSNIKRMLAYSTIAHMGFILLGFAEGTVLGLSAALFYVLTYALTAAAAFGILMLLRQTLNQPMDQNKDLTGLSQQHVGFAVMLAIILLSMAGVPPFVGFDAKLLILKALVLKGHFSLALFAVLFSVVGAYYYLRIIKIMFFDEVTPEKPMPDVISYEGAGVLLIVNVGLVILIGLFPQSLLSLTQSAVLSLS